MKNYIVLLPIFWLLVSCNAYDEESPIAANPQFHLATDVYKLQQTLPEGDTLFINVDLSLCVASGYDKLYITKKKDELYIVGKGAYSFGAGITYFTLPTKSLDYTHSRKVLFNNLFDYLKENEPETEGHTFLEIQYRTDTLRYKSNGLGDKGAKIDEYVEVMQAIYPEEECYNLPIPPLPPPPPPPPVSACIPDVQEDFEP